MKKIYLLILFLILLIACNTWQDELSLRSSNYLERPYSHLSYKEVIEQIKTPAETAHYLENQLNYLHINTCRSFKYIHERGYGLCAEYAIAAAALLSDNNYPPLILQVFLEDYPTISHACYIYQNKKAGKWGTLGIKGENSPDAIFNNMEEICAYLSMVYTEKIIAYAIHDLSDYNFINSNKKIIYNRWNKYKK